MQEQQTFINFDPNDFIIRLSPDVDQDDRWTGDISVSMATTDYNALDNDDFTHLNMLCDMLICAIPLMESDAGFRNKLFSMVSKTFEDKIPEPTIDSVNGNVVKVNFGGE